MRRFYVEDMTKSRKWGKYWISGERIYYFMVYHPELSAWQNILANTGFWSISEKPEDPKIL